MREAEKLCDRLAIMHRGHILAEGTLEELRQEHGENDLEEIFFQLISRHEASARSRPPNTTWFDRATMNFTNVRLILAREVRDQLRDRRTLFMIFVLPILLYPLLGTAYFQMVQFQTQNSMTVLVVGGGQLASAPTPLIEELPAFSPQAVPRRFPRRRIARSWKWRPKGSLPAVDRGDDRAAEASRLVQAKKFDAALVFPPDFAKRLEAYRKAIHDDAARSPDAGQPMPDEASAARTASAERSAASIAEIPRPKIIYTTANERSLMACNRLTAVLDRWTEEVGKTNLVAGGMPAQAVRPFEVDSSNLAGESASKSANIWSRMLPVMLLLWAMTGAFYPAVDLCAGEKERGTLETLLSSPAERSEIVLGKLLTIMAFSMITAALNLVSVGVTGCLVFRQMREFRRAAGAGRGVAVAGPGPGLGLVQRAVPGPGLVRPQHEGRPVLPHAAVDAVAADGRAADDSGRGTEPGQQPDSDLRHGAAAEDVVGRLLSPGLAIPAGGVGRDDGRLLAGRPLGGGAVQQRVGDLPRERAVRRGPLAAAPDARPRGRRLRPPKGCSAAC